MAEVRRIAESINVGAADIIFYPNGKNTAVYLGVTQGGVSVTMEDKYHEIKSDQTGETPLDDVHQGTTVTVEADLLDTSLEKINFVLITSKEQKTGLGVQAVTFGRRPGTRAINHMGKLVIHPLSKAPGDTSMDVILYQTVNTGGLKLEFVNDSEWKIPIKFKGYYDERRPEGDQLFRIGEDIEVDLSEKRVIKFWITPSNPTLSVGETVTFKANAMFEDGSTEDVTDEATWTTSDAQIVSLSGTTATGVKEGSALIRAEYVGYANSTAVVVE